MSFMRCIAPDHRRSGTLHRLWHAVSNPPRHPPYGSAERTNFRIPERVFEIHRFRSERLLFDRRVESDVEFLGQLHITDFPNERWKFLAPALNEATVVDIGCEQVPYGAFLPGEAIRSYIGVDLSEADLLIASREFGTDSGRLLLQNGVYDVHLSDAKADAMISSEVLEHLDDPHPYLQEAYRICKPGGYLSLSTPCASCTSALPPSSGSSSAPG